MDLDEPCWYTADCADPVQTTELVLLPKIAPMPPVARMIASASKVRTLMSRRFIAQMPRHTPCPSSTEERNSQPSYLVTLPSDSYRRTCSSSA